MQTGVFRPGAFEILSAGHFYTSTWGSDSASEPERCSTEDGELEEIQSHRRRVDRSGEPGGSLNGIIREPRSSMIVSITATGT